MASLDARHSRLERLRDTAGAQEAQFAQVERELRELAAGALGDTVTQVLLALILLSICFLISWRLSTAGSQSGEVQWETAGSSTGELWPSGWRRTVLSPLSTEVA